MLPVILIVLVVVWLVQRSRRSSPTQVLPQIPPLPIQNDEYARGVRDALERVQLLSQVSIDDLDSIEHDLLDDTTKQMSTKDWSVATDAANQAVEILPEADYIHEVEVREVDITKPEPEIRQIQPASPLLAPPQKPASTVQFSGINILLSLSSLLFVAAGIAFIASPFANTLKLTVLIVIVGLFYGGGLTLYRLVKRLRPAAVAFVGTGLALIPFLGIAFVQYTSFAPETVWLIISLLGAVAYVGAALALNSQVVSYLAVAFMLSLVASGAASAHAPASGYFVLMIAVSLGASIIARLSPRWVPGVFRAPVEHTGNIVTPLALGAGLLFASVLSVREYELIFALTTTHYVVARMQTGKYWHEQVVRVLAHITLLIVAGDIASGDLADFGIGFVVVALLQFGYSIWAWQREGGHRAGELAWLWVMLGMLVVAPVFWMFDKWSAEYSVAVLLALAASTVSAWWRTKSHGFGFLLLYAGFVLPVACTGLVEPALSPALVGGAYIVYLLALIGYRYRIGWPKQGVARALLGTAVGIYSLSALSALAVEMSGVKAVVGLVVLAVVALVGSYVYKFHWAMVFVAAVVWFSLIRLVSHIDIAEKSFALAVMGALALVMYALCTALFAAHDRKRGSIGLTIGHFSAFVAIAMGLSLHFSPMSDEVGMAVSGLLLIWSLAMVLTVRLDNHAPWRRLMHVIGYPLFYITALAFSFTVDSGWQAVVLVTGALLAWEASYRHRLPHVTILANIFTVWALIMSAVALELGEQSFYAACMVSTALFYAGYWWFRYTEDDGRKGVMITSAWMTIAMALLAAIGLDYWQLCLALGVSIVMFWQASYTYVRPHIVWAANVATVWLALAVSQWSGAESMSWYYATFVAGIVFYASYWWFSYSGDSVRRNIMAVSAWGAVVIAWIASIGHSPWWQIFALVAIISMLWEASFSYRRPWLLVGANLALVWLAYVVTSWQWYDVEWGWFTALATLAAVFYGLSHWMLLRGETMRQRVMLWSAWLVSGLGYLTYVGVPDWKLAASLLGMAGAATCIEAGLRYKKRNVVEVGIYVFTIPLLTLVSTTLPDLNSLFYAHLVAGSVALVGLYRRHSQARYIISLCIVSLFSGVYALSEGGWYSLVFLVEHIVLTLVGVVARRRWAAWWGITGSVLAVFYYLRESPYLVFTLLGVLIVSFVILRLTRKERAANPDSQIPYEVPRDDIRGEGIVDTAITSSGGADSDKK